jgi:hypothetical protein
LEKTFHAAEPQKLRSQKEALAKALNVIAAKETVSHLMIPLMVPTHGV